MAGCSAPLQPDGAQATRPLPPEQVISGFAEYVGWLAQQPAAELETERARLYALPDSTDRSLRLALLYGTRGFAGFNPRLSSQLLSQVSATEPQVSAYGQLAQILASSPPDPATYEEAERLNTQSTGLLARIADEQTHNRYLETQLELARKELEIARTDRARLESQLKALKSLEAQIKGRDEANQ